MGVWEENEILRRGLIASLAEDPAFVVVPPGGDPAGSEREAPDIDVAIVSGRAAGTRHFPCPVIVCSDEVRWNAGAQNGNNVAGHLARGTLTGAVLRATVHAAAAGLMIAASPRASTQPELDPRSKLIVELLAEGLSTREMAVRMSYSERTIKKLITDVQDRLGARSRAQIVARAIRDGLIS